MAVSTVLLLDYMRGALRPLAAGFSYNVDNDSEGWGVATEEKDGKLTGRIIVICDDTKILASFIEEARRLGHTVTKERRLKNTVFVTPKTS